MKKIGMMGFGVVGGGVFEILNKRQDCEIIIIVIRDLKKYSNIILPPNCRISDNPDDLLDDKLDIIIEVAGGVTVTKDIIFKCLKNGKHVVTANKPLTSNYNNDISELCNIYKSSYMYEASVCGGIPIINIINNSYIYDNIYEICGILNGTTNYITTEMTKNNIHYNIILKKAQELGYAEANPDSDVLGWDARSKLCILIRISFGIHINENDVYCKGIDNININDINYAKSLNMYIKLIGYAKKINNNIYCYISPCMIPNNSNLSQIDGVYNAVQIKSEYLGKSLYIGEGAGRYPTANSVVSDVNYLLNNPVPVKPFPVKLDNLKHEKDFSSRFYIRFVVKERTGIIHELSKRFLRFEVSIFAIHQNPIEDESRVPFAIITDQCRMLVAQQLVESIEESRKNKEFDFLLMEPLIMPVHDP
eukprot:GHVL01007179.1.p1 GENE.GHVL01007179.1~~GHVL01007179.1.p1  ORF type:complete len:420 (-),score=143.32 GHVL01007179.1:235-1494(-)